MTKQITISNCSECPYLRSSGTNTLVFNVPFCKEANGRMLPYDVASNVIEGVKHATPTNIIPEWCPLESKYVASTGIDPDSVVGIGYYFSGDIIVEVGTDIYTSLFNSYYKHERLAGLFSNVGYTGDVIIVEAVMSCTHNDKPVCTFTCRSVSSDK